MEFLVTRRGEPILFGIGLGGVTWVNKTIMFDRPIEKIGQELKLFIDGELQTEKKADVVKVVAHWKKVLNKRIKSTGKPLEKLVLTGDFDEFD